MTLDKYFEKHYGDFECECEWYVDPTPNRGNSMSRASTWTSYYLKTMEK